MSVLETFFILFESNSDDLKKGAEEALKVTDGLEDKIKSSDHAATKLGGSFHSMAIAAAGAVAAFVSVGAVISSIRQSIDFADQLEDQSQLLGRTVEELSLYGDAAALAGGSAAGFMGTLSNLSASLAQLDATGKSRVAPFFEELGISLMDKNGKARDTLDLLLDVADKFQGMDKASIVGFGRKLGLDQGTILLLQQGRRGIEDIIARQKDLGVVTEAQAAISNEFNDQLDNTAHIFRTLGLDVAEIVLPPLTKLLIAFQDIYIAAKNSEDLKAFGESVEIVIDLVGDILEPFLEFAKVLWKVLEPLDPLTSIFMAFGGTLLYIADDILHFIAGYDSFIGRIIDSVPQIKGAIEPIIAILKEAFSWIGKVMNPLSFIMSGQLGSLLLKGQEALGFAGASQVNSQTSTSIVAGATSSKNTTVSVGEVNIHTQATDADGIAQGISKGLETQTRQTINNFDDGIRG